MQAIIWLCRKHDQHACNVRVVGHVWPWLGRCHDFEVVSCMHMSVMYNVQSAHCHVTCMHHIP
jgi:hypothetical protein